MEQSAAPPRSVSSEELRRKKTSFTLDFGTKSTSADACATPSKRAKQDLLSEGVLRSPDVGLLALATPDLERLILQQAYGASAAVATTPPGAAAAAASIATTPTQILFPRSVTEEQEAYARGFIDALIELQRQQQQKVTLSPHHVVADPRTGILLPIASPSDDGQSGPFSAVAPLARLQPPAVPVLPTIPVPSTDAGSKLVSLELVSAQTVPSMPVLRPGTLCLSPVARRSTVIPTFTKQFKSAASDSQLLDLSPSGRFAARSLEQAVTVSDRKLELLSTASISLSDNETLVCKSDQSGILQACTSSLNAMNNVESVAVPPKLALPVPVIPVPKLTAPGATVLSTQLPAATTIARDLSVGSAALPTQPIDMSIQEQAKIERKREKNRYAAQKCRMLKLERIERLEKRVNELKQQNEKLSGTSSTLRGQVDQLKQLIVQHVEGGCQIMTVRTLQTTN